MLSFYNLQCINVTPCQMLHDVKEWELFLLLSGNITVREHALFSTQYKTVTLS